MEEKLKGRNLSSGSSQLAHVTNRCFTVLESKGILRTATEEFLLSSRYKPHDELAAEFIRTFRHTFFHGLYFVKRYEALKTGEERVTVKYSGTERWREKSCRRSCSFIRFSQFASRFIFSLALGIRSVVQAPCTEAAE